MEINFTEHFLFKNFQTDIAGKIASQIHSTNACQGFTEA